ncbi:hypothetical protein ACET3Z_000434 [Daucus carota]
MFRLHRVEFLISCIERRGKIKILGAARKEKEDEEEIETCVDGSWGVGFDCDEEDGMKEPPVVGMMKAGSVLGGMGAVKGALGAKEDAMLEKTAFELMLDAPGKIKELVEKIPAVFKKSFSKEEAEQIIMKMKALGAKVVMK